MIELEPEPEPALAVCHLEDDKQSGSRTEVGRPKTRRITYLSPCCTGGIETFEPRDDMAR